MSKASEIIEELKTLIKKHGDLKCFHEDNSCQAYQITGAKYDEDEKEFRIT